MANYKKNAPANNATEKEAIKPKAWTDIAGRMKIRATLWDAGTEKERLALSASINRKNPETGSWYGVELPLVINEPAKQTVYDALDWTDEKHAKAEGNVTGFISVNEYKGKTTLRVYIMTFTPVI